jgi:DNA-binding beta-propeller fold protein YncE
VLGLLTCAALWLPSVSLASDSIYWSGYQPSGGIRLGSLGGSGAHDLFTGESSPEGVAIDPATGQIYWADTTSGTIRVANLDGSGARDLYTGETEPSGVAIDPSAGTIYWANAVSGTGAIRVGNLDGSGTRTLFANESYPVGVVIDPAAGKIYWGSYDTFKIRVGNLDGTGAADLFTGENYPTGIAIDTAAGKLYWTNEFAGTIRVGNLDGTGAANLYTGEVDPVSGGEVGGLALDPAAGKIYWSSANTGTIRVGSLDGSAPAQSLFTGESGTPWFVALLRAPAAAGAPQLSGGGRVGEPLSCGQGSWATDDLSALLYRAPRTFGYQWLKNGSIIPGATSTGYVPTTTGSYGCQVTAVNQAGGTAQISKSVTEALPPPEVGKTANLTPVAGTVLVKLPGSSRFVHVSEARQIPVGSIVDTRGGRVALTAARSNSGATETVIFYGAEFSVAQRASKQHVAVLKLQDTGPACKANAATIARHHPRRHSSPVLWGDGHGSYRTQGGSASATERGTIWETQDRCDGTWFRVKRGSITVTDTTHHKTIVLRAGRTYLARS